VGRLNFEQSDGPKQDSGSLYPMLLFLASAVTSLWMLEVLIYRGL
jgi:hypothetical protein